MPGDEAPIQIEGGPSAYDLEGDKHTLGKSSLYREVECAWEKLLGDSLLMLWLMTNGTCPCNPSHIKALVAMGGATCISVDSIEPTEF